MNNRLVDSDCQPNVDKETDWLSVTSKMSHGDPSAFRTFYDFVYEMMYWEIKTLSNCDDATVLDILQNSMVKLLKCIKPLPDADAVKKWSRCVAKSETYDWFRKSKNRQTVLLELDSKDPLYEQTVIETDARIAWIEKQLLDLEPELQHLISLRYRVGWSFRKIGESLGISTKSVDGRIRRAIEKLSEKAEREFDD